jgi:D-alanyl-D-alanine carboxypeptidase/D-alanyl-D-alanine-endopeptidase (penicillin-binding protein 4)
MRHSIKTWLMGALGGMVMHLSGQAQGLPEAVRQAMQAARLPTHALHVVVVPAAGGPAVLELGAQDSVNPASLMKLITTSVALEQLGPGFQWQTPVLTDGEMVDGELRGNLYVQGRGDPKWVMERLWLLLHRLQTLGIMHIKGDIVLDTSAFEVPATDPAAFDGAPTKPYNASPNALLINFKSVLLHFIPDVQAGVARVVADPPLAGLRLQPSVPLQEGPCIDERATLRANFSDPNQWTFGGSYPLACAQRIWPVAYTDPNNHAARAIEGIWRQIGGQLSGQVRQGRVPSHARTLTVAESPTLSEVIRDINKYSNNLMAEQLFLTLSLEASGLGQAEASRILLQRWWDQHLGVPGLLVDNGSGLSRTGRVSAMGLAKLLQHVWASPTMPELMASMPISGQDGTLRRAKSIASAHLKTGSLRNVLGVAGFVDGQQGQRWVMVAIIEHPQAQAGRPALDQLTTWVASLPLHQP